MTVVTIQTGTMDEIAGVPVGSGNVWVRPDGDGRISVRLDVGDDELIVAEGGVVEIGGRHCTLERIEPIEGLEAHRLYIRVAPAGAVDPAPGPPEPSSATGPTPRPAAPRRRWTTALAAGSCLSPARSRSAGERRPDCGRPPARSWPCSPSTKSGRRNGGRGPSARTTSRSTAPGAGRTRR